MLTAAIATATLAYWVGLQGPFLLDDDANLRSIPEWLAGKLGLTTLLFDRGAGMFGRPVSMASFALNAWIGGYAPFPLKAGNLATHLATGLVVFGFINRLMGRDAALQARATLFAAVVASLWLLHPLHASTVLYIVQRMAQLSTLFVLLGLWLYTASRIRLEAGRSVRASVALLVGVPVMALIAFLSKENGALLPLLCVVVELTYFGGARRSGPVRAFLLLYAAIPVGTGLLAVVAFPQRFIGGYVGRDFSLLERLLSQPRALCDYLFKLVLPNPPRMGIYTDDFAMSTGLLSPPNTLVAILILLAISGAAWHWRKQLPAVAFGWAFFLVAHSLEAGPLPLELYFEHRNYLPSVGIFVAIVALVLAAGRALGSRGIRTGRIGAVTLLGALAVLAFGSHGRAQVWRDGTLIAESALLAHPDSLRANAYILGTSIDSGNEQRTRQALDSILSSPSPRGRALGYAYRVYVDCIFNQSADPADLDRFAAEVPLPLTLYESQPFTYFYLVTQQRPCANIDDSSVGRALARLASRANEFPDNSRDKIQLRYQAASFLLRSGDWQAARTQGLLAWQPQADAPVALPLILSQLQLGDATGAERTLREAEARADPTNAADLQHLRWLRLQVETAKSHSLIPSTR